MTMFMRLLLAIPFCLTACATGPTPDELDSTDTAALGAQTDGASCTLPTMIGWTNLRHDPRDPIYACAAHEPSAITLGDGESHAFSADGLNAGTLDVLCSNGHLSTLERTCSPSPAASAR